MSKGTILFADDEARMRELVSDFLSADGFNVIAVSDGRAAVEAFYKNDNIDLVILDVMMPHMDGYEALKLIKRERDIPIILLTAKTGEYDELRGFNLGTNDFIKKPFRPKILVARCNALINRGTKGNRGERLSACGIILDESLHSITIDGKEASFTEKEFLLLEYFLRNKNVALSRDMILESVWDFDYPGDERTVDTHVKKLRSKLGAKGKHIKTVWAYGYKFEES